MMIDTHCHLDIDDYENVEEIIKKMDGNYIIASGCNYETNKRVIELVNKYDNIFGTIGVHPNEIDSEIEKSIDYIKKNISNPKIVGIGEIGLDFHYDNINKELQKKYFIKQIELANENKKTIVVHSRDAALDTYDILKKYLGDNKAVLHCYSYSKEMAFDFIKMNIKLGIGGVLTFKNSNKLKDVVKNLDLDNFLLETDSPYLTPEPFRGNKNEPYNIIYVAQKIAEIKNVTVDEVLKKTTQNARLQFDLNI